MDYVGKRKKIKKKLLDRYDVGKRSVGLIPVTVLHTT